MVTGWRGCKAGLCAGGESPYIPTVRAKVPGDWAGSVERMNMSARMDQTEILRVKVEVLRREHRDLDEAIHALEERGPADVLTIRRLKKQKLMLKDQIRVLEDRLLPDIIA
jgi:hypothetical protein